MADRMTDRMSDARLAEIASEMERRLDDGGCGEDSQADLLAEVRRAREAEAVLVEDGIASLKACAALRNPPNGDDIETVLASDWAKETLAYGPDSTAGVLLAEVRRARAAEARLEALFRHSTPDPRGVDGCDCLTCEAVRRARAHAPEGVARVAEMLRDVARKVRP